jgi:hypothetical protein
MMMMMNFEEEINQKNRVMMILEIFKHYFDDILNLLLNKNLNKRKGGIRKDIRLFFLIPI